MFNTLPRRSFTVALVVLVLSVILVNLAGARPPSRFSNVGRMSVRPTMAAGPPVIVTLAPATSSPPTSETTVPPAPVAPPALPPAPIVPSGKGMWIWLPQFAEEGDPGAIVGRAQATGLTHLYVRTGSSVDGFNGADFLDALLPVAHAAGLRIIGWDFPYFDDVSMDVQRALDAIRYTTPSGDRLDGFSADIETPSEGVVLTSENVAAYGSTLRANVGPSYTLIATTPRPTNARQLDYPYPELSQSFDAFAPMVYWINLPPEEEAAQALDFLAQFGKPVLPVGQAYDGGLEGGPPGTPTADEIGAFINTADTHGAAGVSFWSWQHASDEMWGAIAAAQEVGVRPNG